MNDAVTLEKVAQLVESALAGQAQLMIRMARVEAKIDALPGKIEELIREALSIEKDEPAQI
jgi:hypothetical protein